MFIKGFLNKKPTAIRFEIKSATGSSVKLSES